MTCSVPILNGKSKETHHNNKTIESSCAQTKTANLGNLKRVCKKMTKCLLFNVQFLKPLLMAKDLLVRDILIGNKYTFILDSKNNF